MRALVTGAGGFLGLALSKQLLAQGDTVISMTRRGYPVLDELGIEQRHADIAIKEAVLAATADIDIIYHVASRTGVWGAWEMYYHTNVLGADNILAACKTHGIKTLVYTSTPSVVFSPPGFEGADESLPYPEHFLCNYPKSKAQAEATILAANGPDLRTTALRPHLIYGPEDPNLLPRLVERGRKRQLKQVGQGNNTVDLTYIDDAARSHILAAKELMGEGKNAGEAYFIASHHVKLWQWINQLYAGCAIAPVSSAIAYPVAYGVGALLEGLWRLRGKTDDPPMTRFVAQQLSMSHWYQHDKARRDFGYVPSVTEAEGLARSLEWLKTTPAVTHQP